MGRLKEVDEEVEVEERARSRVEVNCRVECKHRPLYPAVDGVRGELVPAAPHRAQAAALSQGVALLFQEAATPQVISAPERVFQKLGGSLVPSHIISNSDHAPSPTGATYCLIF